MTKDEWLRRFSYKLQYVMYQKGYSQRKLAKVTGLTDMCIHYYRTGERMPTVRAIVNIAHALDCRISDLVDFGDKIL